MKKENLESVENEKRLTLEELKEKRLELGLSDYLSGGTANCTGAAGTNCPDHGDDCPDGCLPCENWCHDA